MNLLGRAYEAVLRLVFAPRCGVCGAEGCEPWCDICAQSVEPLRGVRCALCLTRIEGRSSHPLCGRCQLHMPQFDGLVCRYVHAGALRQALYLVKFQRRRRLGEQLGALLANGLEVPPEWGVDVVVPVPLHQRRQRERGFNQAELLARPVALALGLPLRADMLQRRLATRPQYRTGSAGRLDNVSTAFQATGAEGHTVLLVDDIVTSGSTLSACAAALRCDGARTVYGVALSRVGRDGCAQAA